MGIHGVRDVNYKRQHDVSKGYSQVENEKGYLVCSFRHPEGIVSSGFHGSDCKVKLLVDHMMLYHQKVSGLSL